MPVSSLHRPPKEKAKCLTSPSSRCIFVCMIINNQPRTTVAEAAFRPAMPLPHYTFTELAQAYFPRTVKTATARRNLRNWIVRKKGLMELLIESGFDPRSRVELPPRVVGLVFDAFNAP